MMKNNTQQRGAVLLIAILVASVALAVGLGVYSRTYKELLLASYWKQAQIAFAAADSGLECALYWELNSAPSAICFGQSVSVLNTWASGNTGTFQLNTITGGGCVKVAITYDSVAVPSTTTTSARGYNASCSVVDTGTNSRVVERGLKVTY